MSSSWTRQANRLYGTADKNKKGSSRKTKYSGYGM